MPNILRKKNRIRFSLLSLLLLVVAGSIVAILVRPHFAPPLKWREFSASELRAQQGLGHPVVVFYRDDWWQGFDDLQNQLITDESELAIRKSGAVLMVANNTLKNTTVESELIRVAGTNFMPTVAIYSSQRSPILLRRRITASTLVDALSQLNESAR